MKGNKKRKLRERRMEENRRKKQHKKSKIDFCEFCGSHKNITKHHIVFKSSGGVDSSSNFQNLCWNCHKKYHKVFEDKNGGLAWQMK